MTTSLFSTITYGWVAIATGIAGLFGLAFIILFFTVGQPFGTLNDICIGLAAILSGVLAWRSYPGFQALMPGLSRLALIASFAGALVAAAGSTLVVFNITGWYLAGLYMAVGNALIGTWLLAFSYAAWHGNALPRTLVIFGIVVGVIMLLGLVALPGIFSRIDSWETAPWYINYIGQAGGLGWLILYPIWCVLLGRMLVLK